MTARDWIVDYLSVHGCTDCGERDLVVLEFDHVGPKRSHVAVMVTKGASPKALAREVANCEVVCANCHRRRTARRSGWRRAEPDWRAEASTRLPGEERNIRFVYEHLEHAECVDCGVTDIVVLDFDHVAGKRATVVQLARSGCGLATLRDEIARCEVRCANCHRRITAERGGHYRAKAS
jgi:5-methylcytosine-specific restriction endonuclease McrA